MPDFSRERVVNIGSKLAAGAALGLVYQTYKYEAAADGYWNIRLMLLVPLGVLFFYILQYLDSRLIFAISRNYTAEMDRENLATFLPLLLPLLSPLHRKLFSNIWPQSFFTHFFVISVVITLVLKAALVIKARKGAGHLLERRRLVRGRLSLCLVFAGAGIIIFWFHQMTIVFGGSYMWSGFGSPEVRELHDNKEARMGFTRAANMSEPILFERSNVTVGYKILSFSSETQSLFNSVPFLFQLRVTGDKGGVLHEESRVVDALSGEARTWNEIKFNVSENSHKKARFKMKMRPLVSRARPFLLLKPLLHNPFDVSYLRDISIRAAWSKPEIVPSGRARPDVILISIDTLRADRLGCYGYSRAVSPAIDSFAREAILYENAFSQATWTLPSHLSLFTSRFPNELRLLNDRPYVMQAKLQSGFKEANMLENTDTTLSETLREDGYYCVAFTEGGFISPLYGFSRGFHIYNERNGPKGDSFRLAEKWLAENKEQDVFLFIHTYLVHNYPADINPDRAAGEQFSNTETAKPDFSDVVILGPIFAPMDPALATKAYDSRVSLVDAKIDTFVSFLKKNNMYENSVIIITSDHGESFGEEHDDGKVRAYSHGNTPYESQIRVPLIIKPPAGTLGPLPEAVSEDVRLIDLAPTILTILALDIPSTFRGRPIPPIASGESDMPFQFVYSSSSTPIEGCIRENHMKYIYDGDSRKEQFYDLKKDPLELHNLAALESPEMLRMKEKYLNFLDEIGRHGIAMEEAVNAATPELAEQLKALGYLN